MNYKITHLTSAHQRYDTRIFLKICTSLAKNDNYEVSLVVADGKDDEVKNGVNIIDVGAKTGGRISRMTRTVKKVFKKAKELDSDIYHFHDPELIPVGVKLKKLGKKVIFDIHENTDLQILEKQWIPSIFRKMISRTYSLYESYACKKFDYLLVPQISMQEKFSKLSRTEVIANFPNNNNEKITNKQIDKHKLLYSGSLGEARGLWNMLNMLEELIKVDENYTLSIAGKVDSKLLARASKHKAWKNINYLGFLSQDELKKVYEDHTVGLIMFNNVGQYHMSYALKLFEYMQNGMIVVMPNFGDWLDFNSENKVGYNVDVKESYRVAMTIATLNNRELEEYAVKNQQRVIDRFSWEKEERKLFKVYEEILNAK